MLRLGILTAEQYASAIKRGEPSFSRVSLNLLDLGPHPTTDEIQRFEEISIALRTSVGTFRTTYRQRLLDVDEVSLRLMRQYYSSNAPLLIQDRAASNCLTSAEFARPIFANFPNAHLEASDSLLHLFRISLPSGETYFVEPGGQLLQYLKPPFVICLYPRESYRFPVNVLLAAMAKRSFRRLFPGFDPANGQSRNGSRVDRISCVHPEARSLVQVDPRFTVRQRSVFLETPGLDVLRTMNILNLGYFSNAKIQEGIHAAFQSLKPGGLWICGRTLQHSRTNHVTFFRRTDENWQVLERFGDGSEIEELITRPKPGHST